ncbi:hypothetical protein, partial [Actinoplanes sp. NPDC051411]|uniref:hypothetical protein n=1 Tax=Actinoplanes sp. NPDC051411 TaxID=3155522 RepID=UPI00341EEC07
MAQLEFFSRSQVASWRARTLARNYSPEAEQFRREHERHREWGLRQRHGRRAMNLRLYGDVVAPADRTGGGRPLAPSAAVAEPVDAERSLVQASSRNVLRGRGFACAGDAEVGEVDPAEQSAPAGATAFTDQSPSAAQAAGVDQPSGVDQAASAGQAASADPADLGGVLLVRGGRLPVRGRPSLVLRRVVLSAGR